MKPEPHRPDADVIDDVGEEVDQPIHRFVVFTWRIFLGSAGFRIFLGPEMSSYSDVACAGVAFSATGTPNRSHCHRAESDSICAEQHQLDHVRARFDSAIGPNLDAIAQSGLEQRAMSLFHADFDRHADVTKRVFARRARATVITTDRDDV